MNPNPSSQSGIILDKVTILTARVEALADFYRDAFELDEASRAPGRISLQIGAVLLSFSHIDAPQTGSRITLWFRVKDIHDSFERLCMAGARVRYPPALQEDGRVLSELEDIDGNRIGLIQRPGG